MFKFNFLSDESSSIDKTNDKTHERIAEQLYQLITNDTENELTIGLEGEWGSGKSTVIKLLKNKIKEADKIFYFYIDAWAHEGDHLRRVFLEKLVNQIKAEKIDNEENLNSLINKIQNRQKTTQISRIPEFDIFGKITTILALLIPLGSAIIEDTISEVTLGFGLPVHWKFVTGVILTCAPLIPFLFKLLYWIIVIKLFNKNNRRAEKFKLHFFKKGDTETTTEISNEEEKSSVEFEKIFNEIDEIIHKKYNKFICVIDNLDRINATDALKIWATLQTFMQNKKKADSKLHKFFIIPYDQIGLQKLWGPESSAETSEEISEMQNHNCSKSFFDKSFQLRLEVPPFTLSGWEQFTLDCLDSAFPDLSKEDKANILNVLKWTGKNYYDHPSPREIKNYINQIGLLYPLHIERVSLISLCYYIILRFLNNLTIEQIKHQLINKKIPEECMHLYENFDSLAEELSAILYNVDRLKGMELLLSQPIIDIIEKKEDIKALQTIKNDHPTVFINIIRQIMQNQNVHNLSLYLLILYQAFSDNTEVLSLLLHYISYRKKDIKNNIKNFDHSIIICIFSIIDKQNSLQKYFKESYEKAFIEHLNNNNYDNEKVLSNFIEIKKNFISDLQIDYAVTGISGIQTILQKCNPSEQREILSESLINLEKIDNDISKRIIDPYILNDFSSPEIIQFVVLKNKNIKWELTLKKLKASYKSNKTLTFYPYSILLELQRSYLNQNDENEISSIVNNYNFWSSLNTCSNSMDFNKCSYLLIKYISSSNTPFHEHSYFTLKDYLYSGSEQLAEYFYETCFSSKDFQCIWKLSTDTKYRLFPLIIDYCITNKKSIFLDTNNDLYQNFSDTLKFYPNQEEKIKIYDYFSTYGKLLNYLIKADVKITTYKEACKIIFQQTKNFKIKEKIEKELEDFSKQEREFILEKQK